VTVIDCEFPTGVIELAQWISRRILSTATRASCCAWNRWFMSSSEFIARTKTVRSAPMTTARMTVTWSSSTSE
jgi:hypothetical protein